MKLLSFVCPFLQHLMQTTNIQPARGVSRFRHTRVTHSSNAISSHAWEYNTSKLTALNCLSLGKQRNAHAASQKDISQLPRHQKPIFLEVSEAGTGLHFVHPMLQLASDLLAGRREVRQMQHLASSIDTPESLSRVTHLS